MTARPDIDAITARAAATLSDDGHVLRPNEVELARAASELAAFVRHLEAQRRRLVPWALWAAQHAGGEHHCDDHAEDGCADFREACELAELIEAGEFGPYQEVAP